MKRLFLCLTILSLAACGEMNFLSRNVTELPPEPRPMLTQENLACLTEAIYFEAGNKGEPGRRAVAHVILNRVKSGYFPSSICGVISEGQSKGKCQFVYRCDLDYKRFIYPDQKQMAHDTAMAVLTGDSEDPTNGALFFHAAYARPGSWFSTRVRVGNYGGNIFYL